MTNRKAIGAVLLVSVVAMVAMAMLSRGGGPSITGQWRTEAPSSLVYDFLIDGVVLLVDGEETRQVFRYELADDGTIKIYDGMGRLRQFTVTVLSDTMTFVNTEPGIRTEVYQRVSDDA